MSKSAQANARQAFHALERLHGLERAVAVVAQDDWGPGSRSKHDVEVAVHLDVRGPGAVLVARDDLRTQAGGGGDVRECAVRGLLHEAEAAGAGQQQVGLEVVVPVDGEHAVGRRRDRLQPAGKCQRRQIGISPAQLAPVRNEDGWITRIPSGSEPRRRPRTGRDRPPSRRPAAL